MNFSWPTQWSARTSYIVAVIFAVLYSAVLTFICVLVASWFGFIAMTVFSAGIWGWSFWKYRYMVTKNVWLEDL